MDGTSILPTITDPDVAWRSGFLLERGKMTHARYAKVFYRSTQRDLIGIDVI